MTKNFKPLTFGFDVDLTIVDPSINNTLKTGTWLHYLNNISHNYISEEYLASLEKIDYNLGNYFPDLLSQEAYWFWEQDNLYQKLEPYKACVDFINSLASSGHNIVFISHCKRGHYSSKVEFVKQHFNIPEKQFGFLATKEKHYADIDFIFDDRNNFLNLFKNKPDVVKIKFKTPYSQDEELNVSIDLCSSDWQDISKFVRSLI